MRVSGRRREAMATSGCGPMGRGDGYAAITSGTPSPVRSGVPPSIRRAIRPRPPDRTEAPPPRYRAGICIAARPLQRPEFGRSDGPFGRREPRGAPGFDLHEVQHTGVPGHDVEFVAPCAPVSSKDVVTRAAQIFRRSPLAGPARFGARHGRRKYLAAPVRRVGSRGMVGGFRRRSLGRDRNCRHDTI